MREHKIFPYSTLFINLGNIKTKVGSIRAFLLMINILLCMGMSIPASQHTRKKYNYVQIYIK